MICLFPNPEEDYIFVGICGFYAHGVSIADV